MAVIEIYPYVDEQVIEHENLVQYKSDEGKQIIQLETGRIYDEAIDSYPCRYTYAEMIQPEEKEIKENVQTVEYAN